MRILNNKSADCGCLFGLDIGGTLTKMVYFQSADGAAVTQRRQMEHYLTRFSPCDVSERCHVEGSLPLIDDFIMSLKMTEIAQREERLQMFVPELNGTLHFINFPTAKMDNIIDFVRRRFFHRYIKKIACTGGGAFKFSSLFESRLGIELQKTDEMDGLIQGLNFVLKYAPDECYTFVNVIPGTGLGSATRKMLPKPNKRDLYPFLLVNIGSGVSIIKITGELNYERVSGTSLGGGTFLGLCRTLSKLRTFDEAMDASIEGNSNELDMTVGDIYGPTGYEQFQLKPDTVASSFGKASASQPPRDADLARSLLFMITQNLGQLAFLNARRAETKRIYFSGNFLRRNELACRQLAYAISFWSKGEMQAQFFHHEGFFGALGTFLQRYSLNYESPVLSKSELEESGDDQNSCYS
ncbi:pantothenate kinase [Plasmopara halstedii]|uniref:pantothenate kinase n=1 Tax=Plasmopara halstedii TaxID=4781 RepID=A0A0P1ATC0_PLAHL|nr:pantothenate kinase [Plasmopara halstedii]CEG43965.1 pantothenate kinase [Plasmopara halstedii]|eukprot:XP_024580334.1 pantothenate kinase [Plasmopara halstedii]